MHVNKKDKQVKLKFKIIHIFINIAIIKIKFVHDNIVITQSNDTEPQFTVHKFHNSQFTNVSLHISIRKRSA